MGFPVFCYCQVALSAGCADRGWCVPKVCCYGAVCKSCNTGSSEVVHSESCKDSRLSRLSKPMAAAVRSCVRIQEEIYHCWYLYCSLGSSELDDRNAVGVLGKILGTLDTSWSTAKGGN